MAAKRSADPLVASEGRCLEREERLELRLPFLLPDGGYSCDTVGGIPPGFTEFLEPICRKGKGNPGNPSDPSSVHTGTPKMYLECDSCDANQAGLVFSQFKYSSL